MTPLPDSGKSMGAAAQALLALAFLCWIAMLGSIGSWIGKAPTPGRETDRVVQQAYSAGAAVLLWIFLAGLLLVANSKHVLPGTVGAIAWIAAPLSGLGTLAAIAVLYDPQRHWPLILPAAVPLLIGGYVVYTFFPTVQTISISTAGMAMWGAVFVLSVSIVPSARVFLETHGSRAVRAEPGPELDRFMANERDRARADGLAELSKMDEETKLYEVVTLMRPNSPVRQEALEFARRLPNRQEEMVRMLVNLGSEPLLFLADIDIQPTPELCGAARHWLHQAVVQRQKMFHSGPEPFVGAEFEEGLRGIQWISTYCGCEKELDEIEAYARSQDQNAPAVQKFLAGLAAIREKK
jgi:hypothetical protein